MFTKLWSSYLIGSFRSKLNTFKASAVELSHPSKVKGMTFSRLEQAQSAILLNSTTSVSTFGFNLLVQICGDGEWRVGHALCCMSETLRVSSTIAARNCRSTARPRHLLRTTISTRVHHQHGAQNFSASPSTSFRTTMNSTRDSAVHPTIHGTPA